MVHIQYRIVGDVEERLLIRGRNGGTSYSALAKQDIQNYWQMIEALTPRFTEPEALALLDAINGTHHDISNARLLWHTLDDMGTELTEKWGVDTQDLVARVRGLGRGETMALVVALGLAWDYLSDLQVTTSGAVRRAGLVDRLRN